MRYFIIFVIAIYPIIALIATKNMVKKNKSERVNNPKKFIDQIKRIVYVKRIDDAYAVSFDKGLYPVFRNNIDTIRSEEAIKADNRVVTYAKHENFFDVVLADEELIGRDFRSVGNMHCKKGFVRPNMIYRIAELKSLKGDEVNEFNKYNIKQVYCLTKGVDCKNKELGFGKNNINEYTVMNEIVDIMSYSQAKDMDFYSWYANRIYNSLMNDKKRVGRTIKSIMRCEEPLVITDGFGNFQNAVVSALLLYALDVDVETIVADYTQSNEFLFEKYGENSDYLHLANGLVMRKLFTQIKDEYKKEEFFKLLDIEKEDLEAFNKKMIIEL